MAQLVPACDSENVLADGTCAVPYWVEFEPVLPPLTASEGVIVSVLVIGVWIAGAAFKWMRKAVH